MPASHRDSVGSIELSALPAGEQNWLLQFVRGGCRDSNNLENPDAGADSLVRDAAG